MFADGHRLAVAVNDENDDNQCTSISIEIWELDEIAKVRTLTGLTEATSIHRRLPSRPTGAALPPHRPMTVLIITARTPTRWCLVWDADSGEKSRPCQAASMDTNALLFRRTDEVLPRAVRTMQTCRYGKWQRVRLRKAQRP